MKRSDPRGAGGVAVHHIAAGPATPDPPATPHGRTHASLFLFHASSLSLLSSLSPFLSSLSLSLTHTHTLYLSLHIHISLSAPRLLVFTAAAYPFETRFLVRTLLQRRMVKPRNSKPEIRTPCMKTRKTKHGNTKHET